MGITDNDNDLDGDGIPELVMGRWDPIDGAGGMCIFATTHIALDGTNDVAEFGPCYDEGFIFADSNADGSPEVHLWIADGFTWGMLSLPDFQVPWDDPTKC